MFTLARETVCEEEIKKSRFVVKGAPVTRSEDAFAFLERIRKARATHHCWAYRIGQDYRFSDDGEPAGTAGIPILNAIEKQTIDQVMVVVIRYYGGIKLGAGGLVRAYGGCTAKCLQAARLRPIIVSKMVKLKAGFDCIGSVYPIINQFNAEKLAEQYTENGLELTLRINQADFHSLSTTLKNVSSGKIEVFDANLPVPCRKASP